MNHKSKQKLLQEEEARAPQNVQRGQRPDKKITNSTRPNSFNLSLFVFANARKVVVEVNLWQ